MTSNLNTLKIQVPPQRPAPASAAAIGELAVRLLSAGSAAVAALGRVVATIGPSAYRAELRRTVSELQADRPELARRLHSISGSAWTH